MNKLIISVSDEWIVEDQAESLYTCGMKIAVNWIWIMWEQRRLRGPCHSPSTHLSNLNFSGGGGHVEEKDFLAKLNVMNGRLVSEFPESDNSPVICNSCIICL